MLDDRATRDERSSRFAGREEKNERKRKPKRKRLSSFLFVPAVLSSVRARCSNNDRWNGRERRVKRIVGFVEKTYLYPSYDLRCNLLRSAKGMENTSTSRKARTRGVTRTQNEVRILPNICCWERLGCENDRWILSV